MEPKKDFRFSDDVIVYIRDIMTLGLLTQTDITNHLRQMRFDTELRGEVEYLVPSEEYKQAYAIVAEQLVRAIAKIEADDELEEN